jgi:preprotein translocase subunit SecA
VLKNKQRDEVVALLVEYSRRQQQKANQAIIEARQKVDSLFAGHEEGGVTATVAAHGNGALDSLGDWLRQDVQCDVPNEELASLDREELERRISTAIEDRFRAEIRRMERMLVLQILDNAWKDHLLAMDHLKASVGLRGYAQVDPKVEYKREGMRTFELMWGAIGERVTDLIFRMEQLNEDFVGSTWVGGQAIHQEAPTTSEIARQQQAGIDASQGGDRKQEPIRHRGQRVGRNDPCPCGSGKKFKNCCMRSRGLVA